MNRDRLFAVIISSKAVIPERSAWRPSGRHRGWMHGGKSPGGPLIRPLRQLAVVPERVGVGAHGPCVQSNDQLVLCRCRTRHRAERASLGDFAEQLACAFRQKHSPASQCPAAFGLLVLIRYRYIALQRRATRPTQPILRKARADGFAADSPLEQAGFELAVAFAQVSPRTRVASFKAPLSITRPLGNDAGQADMI